jgi:nucleoid-associated protein YgaU
MLGSLKKAQIKVVEGVVKGSTIPFLYNPDTITYKKQVKWNEDKRASKNIGDLNLVGGHGATFSIAKALFDTTLPASGKGRGTGNDVRDHTDNLIKLMEVDASLKPKAPPKCQFIWGSFVSFEVYVTSVQLTFDMFSPGGAPMRAWADIEFKQASDDGQLKRQNPTSGSYARKIWTVVEGETLDWIAYQEYGDPAAWRHIAEINNLANPMSLHPGQLLKLTPLE